MGTWLHKLQNMVQMVLLVNNNQSNSRWQNELGLLGHTGLYTKPQSYRLMDVTHFVPSHRGGQAQSP